MHRLKMEQGETIMYKAMIMACMMGTFDSPQTCTTFEDSYSPSADYDVCVTRANEMMLDIQDILNKPFRYYYQCVPLKQA